MTNSSRSRIVQPRWGFFVLGITVVLLVFIAVSIWVRYHWEQQVHQSATPIASVEQTVMILPAPEISPGDRPKSLRGAQFFPVDEFVKAFENEKLTVGEWVCVEGRVNHAGERMGAAYLTLRDANVQHTCRLVRQLNWKSSWK